MLSGTHLLDCCNGLSNSGECRSQRVMQKCTSATASCRFWGEAMSVVYRIHVELSLIKLQPSRAGCKSSDMRIASYMLQGSSSPSTTMPIVHICTLTAFVPVEKMRTFCLHELIAAL